MAFVLFLWLAFLPPNQTPPKCSLSGTVVDSVTGKALGKVELRLQPLAGQWASTTNSSTDGRFALADLEPGRYRLVAIRSGYLQMAYGSHGSGRSGTILKLDAGQDLANLQFEVTPAGSIAGTIRDSDGEPIEFAEVIINRLIYSSRGRPHLERVGGAHSDDRGEYRIHGLEPGKYYVSAAEQRLGGGTDHSANTRPAEAAVTTFYPGTPDPSAASPVELSPGAHVLGIDVTPLRLHAVCVSGRAAPPAKALSLFSRSFRADTFTQNPAGDFRFCGVPAGSYELDAWANPEASRTMLNVGDADVKDLHVTVSPGADIEVHMSVEGDEKPDFKDLLFRVSQDGDDVASTSPPADGSFAIPNLRPGRYDIDIEANAPRLYVKSIRFGDTDILADGLTVSGPGKIPIAVVLATDSCGVSGTVAGKDSLPAAGATVLLAPDLRSRLDLFQVVSTDQAGRYEFSGLAPGNYHLFAWDEVEWNQWYDADFLKTYEKQSEVAALNPKARVTVNLQIAAVPDGQ